MYKVNCRVLNSVLGKTFTMKPRFGKVSEEAKLESFFKIKRQNCRPHITIYHGVNAEHAE